MEERIIKDINNLLTQLFQKIKEAGYVWYAEKKELMKIEQESTWNEKIKGLNELETYILSLVPDRSLDAIKVDAKNIRYIIDKGQKPSYSEEDEKISNAIYESIDFLCLEHFGVSEDEACDWLKSLKERCVWVDGEKFVKMYGDFVCNAKTLGIIIENFKGFRVLVAKYLDDRYVAEIVNPTDIEKSYNNEVSYLQEQIDKDNDKIYELKKSIDNYNHLPWWKRMFKKIEVK